MEENTGNPSEEFKKTATLDNSLKFAEGIKQREERLRFRNRLAKAAMPELIRITTNKYPSSFWDACKLFARRLGINVIVGFKIDCDPLSVSKQAYIFADAMLNQINIDHNKTSGDGKN